MRWAKLLRDAPNRKRNENYRTATSNLDETSQRRASSASDCAALSRSIVALVCNNLSFETRPKAIREHKQTVIEASNQALHTIDRSLISTFAIAALRFAAKRSFVPTSKISIGNASHLDRLREKQTFGLLSAAQRAHGSAIVDTSVSVDDHNAAKRKNKKHRVFCGRCGSPRS